MQRVVVMGPPGSGKSTLARQLGARCGLPVFHLDQVYWRSGWIEAPADVFAADVERIAALPAWVIDGNFTPTIVPRFRRADTVIYLDTPSWLSILRIVRRIARDYGRVRPDLPEGCPERLDLPFLLFVLRWNRERRAESLTLVESFGGNTILIRGRRELQRFLAAQGPRGFQPDAASLPQARRASEGG